MLFISILSLITAKAVKLINISHIHFTRISFIILLYAGALTFNVLYIQSIGSGIGIYNGFFHITQINQIIEIFIFLIGGLILTCFSLKQRNIIEKPLFASFIQGDKHSTDYAIIILFSILGSSLLISSYDLISIYLSIELQSFGLYILSTLYRESESSTSAGLKYFLLGGLSSCIILLGIGIIYSYTGITNLESLYILNSSFSEASEAIISVPSLINIGIDINVIQGLSLGIILIFIGFLFKIAAAPLHNWSPDVYDEVPTIVTTWLTIIPKISILILFLELQSQLQIIGIPVLRNILLISSLLSLIIGSILGLAQIKIKRLLAYSTISHIGFILLAIAINTEQSIDSFIFYIIQYTITNLNIFLILLAISYIFYYKNTMIKDIKDIKYISELKGFFFINPILSISFGLCLFSMAGIPPLIGFFSKQFVLYSALQNGYYFISIIAILVSVISASYYLQIIKNIFHLNEDQQLNNCFSGGEPDMNITPLVTKTVTNISNIHSYLISILSLIILFFFIKPTILLNCTQLLSLSLFYI